VILMLFGVDDIGPMFIEHAGNARHKAFAIRAID